MVLRQVWVCSILERVAAATAVHRSGHVRRSHEGGDPLSGALVRGRSFSESCMAWRSWSIAPNRTPWLNRSSASRASFAAFNNASRCVLFMSSADPLIPLLTALNVFD
jgi:hypothetical protein